MVFKSISEALTVPKIKESSARAKVNKKVLSEKIFLGLDFYSTLCNFVYLFYFFEKRVSL